MITFINTTTFLVILSLAQLVLTITNPISITSQSQFNLTSSTSTTFLIPSSEFNNNPSIKLIYVTLSLCSAPINYNLTSILPNSLYLSNSTSSNSINATPTIPLLGGFSNLTITLPSSSLDIKTSGIYIGILCPPGGIGNWKWELTTSTNLDGGSFTELYSTPGFKFEDSDNARALISTSNYSSNLNVSASLPSYIPIVRVTSSSGSALRRSMCAVQSSSVTSSIVSTENINSTITTRGYGGGLRLQYELSNLQSGTNYTSWLVEDLGQGRKRLFEPIYFLTKTGESSL